VTLESIIRTTYHCCSSFLDYMDDMDAKNVLFLAVLLRFDTFCSFSSRIVEILYSVWEVVHGCVLSYSLQFTLYRFRSTIFRS